MSDAAMVLGTADRLMADQCDDATVRRARRGAWPASLWNAIAQMGLPLALVPEGSGGFGLDPVDAFALARLAGRHALPLPLGETMAANQALALAGLPLAEGPAAFVPVESGLVLRDGRITGTADRVPWGATVGTLVVEYLLGGARHVARLDSGWRVAESGTNIAHMPRDCLSIDAAITATAPAQGHPLYLMGAGLRVLQIAGALDQVLDLSIAHVSDRKQFGRALATFQAIQHELARIAGEAAAAGAAAGLAAEALAEAAGDPMLSVAAARIRSAEAASVAAGVAQQLHGAIGFTQEHRLHWYTSALWSWRDEYGGPHHLTQCLGAAALAVGRDGFWPFVVAA